MDSENCTPMFQNLALRRRSWSTTNIDQVSNFHIRHEKETKKVLEMSYFVPQRVLNILKRPDYCQDKIMSENIKGALLVADISGFTKICQEFSALGDEAIEEGSKHINQYFTTLLKHFESNGGDVLFFAGDALMVLFAQPRGTPGHLGIGRATLNATRCAFECTINPALSSYRADGFRIQLHLAISAGNMQISVVGQGYASKRAYVVSGPPVTNIGTILSLSKKCDVVLTPEAWRHLGAFLEHPDNPTPSIVSALCMGDCAYKVTSVYDPSPRHPLVKITPHASLHSLLTPFLPATVYDKLETNRLEFVAALCNATVVFVSPEIDASRVDPDTIRLIHEFFVCTVDTYCKYGGMIRQCCIDDKGVTCIAAFSVPPLVHEDDPFRAVAASLELLELLKENGVKCKVGIATGKVGCGLVGSHERREFSIIGDIVNLAARLCYSQFNNQIICDETTYRLTKSSIKYLEGICVPIKGRTSATVFIPLSISMITPSLSQKYLVGREQELSLIQDLKMQAMKSCQVLLLEGAPGGGKSALLEHISQTAGHFYSVKAKGVELKKMEDVLVWKIILENLFIRYPQCRLCLDDHIRRHHFGHMSIDGSLPGQLLRSKSTPANIVNHFIKPACIIDLFKKIVGLSPTLILIDDANWIDNSSWDLLNQLIGLPLPILIVVAFRHQLSLESRVSNLINEGAVHHVLKDLDLPFSLQLLEMQLKVKHIQPEIMQCIYSKSKGNPWFTLELANHLQESQQITIANGECIPLPSFDPSRVQLPNSMVQLVGSMLSKLPPELMTCCQIASVFGMPFSVTNLHQVYPVDVSLTEVKDMVNELVLHKIFVQCTPEQDTHTVAATKDDPPEASYRTRARRTRSFNSEESSRAEYNTPTPKPIKSSVEDYEFSHNCFQEATYSFLPFELRRSIHKKISALYENSPKDWRVYAHHISRTLKFQSPVSGDSNRPRHRLGVSHDSLNVFRAALSPRDKRVRFSKKIHFYNLDPAPQQNQIPFDQ